MNGNNTLVNVTPEPVSPGALLSSYRKKLNMPESEAAGHLKISAKRLKAIEADDYSDFPSPTYTRGYLRNYARLVNVEDTRIIEVYESYFSAPNIDNGVEEQQPALNDEKPQKRWWFVYLILVLVVILWVVSYGLLNMDKPSPSAELKEPEESVINLAATARAQVLPQEDEMAQTATPAESLLQSSVEAETMVEPDPVPSELTQDVLKEASNEESAIQDIEDVVQPLIVSKVTAAELVNTVITPEPPQERDDTAVNGQLDHQLKFTFSNECWVEVSDKNGTLYAKLQQPDTELVLSGEPPFRIIIGNIDGTAVFFNGEPVTLVAEEGRKFARLRVGG